MNKIKVLFLCSSFFLLGCTAINMFANQKEYATSVSFNSQSCELAVSGAVDNKLVSLFQQTLQSNTQIKNCKELIVVLSSTGGNVYPAFNLGNMIRANNYSTKIAENNICVSACGLVFMSGVKRYMAMASADTKVGFHQMIRIDGGSEKCIDVNENSDLISSYNSYVKKMLPEKAADFYMQNIAKVSCRSVKYYNAEVLSRYGIVTNTY